MKRKLILVVLLFSSVMLLSKETAGVFFPDTLESDGKKLVLNGVGLRLKKVLLLEIKVYAGGLYLEQKNQSPKEILGDDKAKAVVMHFLYKKVDSEKLREAFVEGFEANSPAEAKTLKPQIDKFLAFWPEMLKDDQARMIYVPGVGTRVIIKGKEAGLIEGPQFAKLLFSIWLGPKPPNQELKTGMLLGS